MSMWIISRGVVLLILLMEYKFQVGYNGFTSHVITTIADRIREKDTSQSKQNLQSSSMTFIHKTLIIPSVLDSCFISSTVSEVKRYSAYVRRIVADSIACNTDEYSPSPDGQEAGSLENSEDIFSFGSALEDFIYVVFVPDRNILSLEIRCFNNSRILHNRHNILTDNCSQEMLDFKFQSLVLRKGFVRICLPEYEVGKLDWKFKRCDVISTSHEYFLLFQDKDYFTVKQNLQSSSDVIHSHDLRYLSLMTRLLVKKLKIQAGVKFQDQENSETSSAFGSALKDLFVLYLYLIEHVFRRAFRRLLHGLGEVNHKLCINTNGYMTVKDTEEQAGEQVYKSWRTQKTSSALEAL
ncbi:hypothetical protein Tco_0596712 [Tanacetum coccineum]